MKAEVLLETLQKQVTLAVHAVSTRSQLPILSHILLEAREDRLIISSTDLEIGIQTTQQAVVLEEGGVTVPAKLFLELLNSLPQEKITLQTKENSLEVIAKKSRSVLQTTPREEFPSLFEEKGKQIVSFEKASLKSIFGRIVFSASLESTRPALSGILLTKSKNGFLAVATDGYRLSLEEVGTEKATLSETLEKPVLIPARVIREAMSLGGERVSVYVSEQNNQVLFEQEGAVLVGRLIDAVFPNYEKVIPTDVATTVAFDREELQKAVKTCSIFARETANIITLSLTKEKIIVSAKTPSLGENTVEVDARLTGEENAIAFNARYLLDALANISENELTFEMTGPLNPGVFRTGSSFLHLIMPIRTQG